MQKITPFLWLNDQAEEAANFYVSVFKNSKVLNMERYGPEAAEASGRPEDSLMTASFLLDGQEFVALNGGPVFKISPAISFVVNCETQAEVDEYWQKLTAGGEEVQCGWLTDKFGVSWQIVPAQLGKLLGDLDKVKAGRVWQAMLQMKKIDIAGLQRAYDQS
ncbi:MAG: VOC family protein [Nitrosomonadales bacterium]|nr:VOC family protein [Nitrosomonadales bacterium]